MSKKYANGDRSISRLSIRSCGRDALGTTLEFKRPGTFNAIKDMVGGGPFGLNPGNGQTIPQWLFALVKA